MTSPLLLVSLFPRGPILPREEEERGRAFGPVAHGREGTFRDIPCSQSPAAAWASCASRESGGLPAPVPEEVLTLCPGADGDWVQSPTQALGELHAWILYLFVFIVGSPQLQWESPTSGTGPNGPAVSPPLHSPSLPLVPGVGGRHLAAFQVLSHPPCTEWCW